MEFIKKIIKKLIGKRNYYKWLTLNRIHFFLLKSGLISNKEFKEYRAELEKDNFIKEMFSKRKSFLMAKIAANSSYSFGGMDITPAVYLYSLIRRYKPRIIIETGVNNGFSTAFILKALNNNNEGKLISVDMPGEVFSDPDFWKEMKKPQQSPGWTVPEDLKDRWELIAGDSREHLPLVFSRIELLDIFLHDGLHTYDNMFWEFEEAYKRLHKGGFLISDDITHNNSMFDFAKKIHKNIIELGGGVGLIVKD